MIADTVGSRIIVCLALSTGIVSGQALSVHPEVSEVIEKKVSTEPWTAAPDGVRGVKFGASESDLKNAVGRIRCSDVRLTANAIAYRQCEPIDNLELFSIGGKRLIVRYFFVDDRLLCAEIRPRSVLKRPSDTPSEDEALTAFIADYGSPMITAKVRVTGTREKRSNEFIGKQYAGARIEFVPYEKIRMVYEWTNEKVMIQVRGEDRLFDYALIQTRSWPSIVREKSEAHQ
jgi:hypothetical protein